MTGTVPKDRIFESGILQADLGGRRDISYWLPDGAGRGRCCRTSPSREAAMS